MTIDNYATALLGRVKNTQTIAGREAHALCPLACTGSRGGGMGSTLDGFPLAPATRVQIDVLGASEAVSQAAFGD